MTRSKVFWRTVTTGKLLRLDFTTSFTTEHFVSGFASEVRDDSLENLSLRLSLLLDFTTSVASEVRHD